MAPYKSEAQRKKFHAMLERGEISAKTVAEFDEASKGKKLPERLSSKKNPPRKITSVKQLRKIREAL